MPASSSPGDRTRCRYYYDAAFIDRVDQMKTLLKENPGLNVNQQDKDGLTALHGASENGHVGVVKVLLAHPLIDVKEMSKDGFTALHIASQKGHVEVVKVLIPHPHISKTKMAGLLFILLPTEVVLKL